MTAHKPTVLGENMAGTFFGGLVIVAILLVSWLYHGPMSDSAADAVHRVWLLSFWLVVLLLGVTCRVTATPGGIDVVNPFRVHHLPADQVEEVGAAHGLVLRLRDGREVRAFILVRSPRGERRGYPEAQEVRRRIEHHLRYGARTAAGGPAAPSTRFRWRSIAAGVALSAVNLAVTAAVATLV